MQDKEQNTIRGIQAFFLKHKSFFSRFSSALVMGPVSLLLFYLGGLPFALLLIAVYALSIYEWANLSLKCPRSFAIMIGGFLYITLSFLTFYLLRLNFSFELTLLFVLMVWFSDSGAYFVGKTVGGPKLIKDISPKKTWSGFSAALLFPAIIFVAYTLFFHFAAITATDSLVIFIAGAIIGGVGQLGDLVVSFFKRMASIKDTSSLIPGHGGILDRLDSMLLACPVFLLMVSELSSSIGY